MLSISLQTAKHLDSVEKNILESVQRVCNRRQLAKYFSSQMDKRLVLLSKLVHVSKNFGVRHPVECGYIKYSSWFDSPSWPRSFYGVSRSHSDIL
jgi:hypothetical protein